MSVGEAVADDGAGGWAGAVGPGGFSVIGGFEKRDPGLDFASVMNVFLEDARPIAARKTETDDPQDPKTTVLSSLVTSLRSEPVSKPSTKASPKASPKASQKRKERNSSTILKSLITNYVPIGESNDLDPLAVQTVPAEFEDPADFQVEIVNDGDNNVHLDDYRTFYDEGLQSVP